MFVFSHYFTFLRRGYYHNLPLWKKGMESVKAPVFFSDVASGMMNVVKDPEAKGQIYEFYGPEKFLFADLIDWMHHKTWRDEYDWGYRRDDLRFSPVAIGKILLSEYLPIGRKWMGNTTIDKIERVSQRTSCYKN